MFSSAIERSRFFLNTRLFMHCARSLKSDKFQISGHIMQLILRSSYCSMYSFLIIVENVYLAKAVNHLMITRKLRNENKGCRSFIRMYIYI